MVDPTPGDPTTQSRAAMSAEGLLAEERDPAPATEAGSTRAAGAGIDEEQLADQVAGQTDSSGPTAQAAGTAKGPDD